MDEYAYFEQFVGDVEPIDLQASMAHFAAALSIALEQNPDLYSAMADLKRQGLWVQAAD